MSESYECYKNAVGGVTFNGDKMKDFTEMTEYLQKAWNAVDKLHENKMKIIHEELRKLHTMIIDIQLTNFHPTAKKRNHYDKKHITTIVFHEDHKNKGHYYKGVCVKRYGKYLGYDFNDEKERMDYMQNYCEMDNGLKILPPILKIEEGNTPSGNKYIKYIFNEGKKNSGYSFNDWCDFSFAYEGGEFENEKTDEDEDNDEFMNELNLKLGK